MIQPIMFLAARRYSIAVLARLPLAAAMLSSALAAHAGAGGGVTLPAPKQVLHSPVGITEVGLLAGAEIGIDVPKNWNHSLVVFDPGLAREPVSFHLAARLENQQLPFF